jgi:hypothetical protein
MKMMTGTMLKQREVQLSMPKAATKAPTIMRKMLPAPIIEPANRTSCEGERVSAYFVKIHIVTPNFESNFSHRKNLGELRGFGISQQRTNQSLLLMHHL